MADPQSLHSLEPVTEKELDTDSGSESEPTQRSLQNRLQALTAYHDSHQQVRISKNYPRTLLWAAEHEQTLTHKELRDVIRCSLHTDILIVLDTIMLKRHCHAQLSQWYPHRARVRSSKEDWKALKHCQRAADGDLLAERISLALAKGGCQGGAVSRERQELIERRVTHHCAKGDFYTAIAKAQDRLVNGDTGGGGGVNSLEDCERALTEYRGLEANARAKEAK